MKLEGALFDGLVASLGWWACCGLWALQRQCSATREANPAKKRSQLIQSNKRKEREWTLLRRQQPTKRIGVGAAEERRSKVNGAPSSSRCAASPSTHSSFVGPLRAIKKMSWVEWFRFQLLPCSSAINENIFQLIAGAELRERKTNNFSFLHWWGPQPIKEKEIGFSFFNWILAASGYYESKEWKNKLKEIKWISICDWMTGGWPPKREQQTPFHSIHFSLRMRNERMKLDCLLAGHWGSRGLLLNKKETSQSTINSSFHSIKFMIEKMSWLIELSCLWLAAPIIPYFYKSCRGPFRSTNFNYSFHLLAAVINQFSLFHSINFFDWKRERVDLMK